MDSAVISAELKTVLDCCTGIQIYFIDDDNNQIYDTDIHNGVLDDFRVDFVKNLQTKYTNNEKFTTPELSNADDRAHALYLFDFDIKPLEFEFLDKVNSLPADRKINLYQVRQKGLSSIKAIIIRLKGDNGKIISFYQYIHSSAFITPQRSVFLTTHKTRVIRLTEDVLRLNHKFIFAKVGNYYLVENVNMLEKELGFDKVIHSKAQSYCSSLAERELVADLKKFNSKVDNETAFARKFVKVFKNSAVIEQDLSNQEIINFAMSKPFYQGKLKLTDNGDKFDLNSQQRCHYFLQLLDDEFLRSELTGLDYIARAKDRASL
jgi:hypothetical protein